MFQDPQYASQVMSARADEVRVIELEAPHRTPSGEEADQRLTPAAMVATADIVMVLIAWGVALLALGLLGATLPQILAAGAIPTAVAAAGIGRRDALRVGAIRSQEVQRILTASLLTGAAILLVWGTLESAPYLPVILGVALSGVLLNAGRGYVRWWVGNQRTEGDLGERTLVVGHGEDAAQVLQLLSEHPEQGMQVVGLVGEAPIDGATALYGGPVSHALSWAARTGATSVVVLPSALSIDELNELTRDLLRADLSMHLWTGLSGFHHTRLQRSAVARQPMLSVKSSAPSRVQLAAKRGLDIVVAASLLVLTAPILAGAALAIRVTSGAGVVFRQVRIGKDGESFELLKLRSMVTDAEVVRQQLVDDNERTGPLFKMTSDPRVTPVGRFLRASSIDELPQLWNVLRGEMSLIGPRPALVEEHAAFDEALRARTKMLPGISGLWQIEARDNPHFGAYRRLDLFYIQNWSLMLDLGILFATAGLVVLRCLKLITVRLPRTAAQPLSAEAVS